MTSSHGDTPMCKIWQSNAKVKKLRTGHKSARTRTTGQKNVQTIQTDERTKYKRTNEFQYDFVQQPYYPRHNDSTNILIAFRHGPNKIVSKVVCYM